MSQESLEVQVQIIKDILLEWLYTDTFNKCEGETQNEMELLARREDRRAAIQAGLESLRRRNRKPTLDY